MATSVLILVAMATQACGNVDYSKIRLKLLPQKYLDPYSKLRPGKPDSYTSCMCPSSLNTTGSFYMFCGPELNPKEGGQQPPNFLRISVHKLCQKIENGPSLPQQYVDALLPSFLQSRDGGHVETYEAQVGRLRLPGETFTKPDPPPPRLFAPSPPSVHDLKTQPHQPFQHYLHTIRHDDNPDKKSDNTIEN
ncbi:hypothetical protein Fcan01_26483 [Folsomia candida]|uniref:Uncharacterized protein n=1 Tax=Folsomia candida TaxID=158441 RepID=A0A226CZK5_FOLCA|nr:hypothetical protein Fcan01_26483 [Folsomia candida]